MPNDEIYRLCMRTSFMGAVLTGTTSSEMRFVRVWKNVSYEGYSKSSMTNYKKILYEIYKIIFDIGSYIEDVRVLYFQGMKILPDYRV